MTEEKTNRWSVEQFLAFHRWLNKGEGPYKK